MTAARNTTEAHRWSFFRAGGVDQVLIKTGADIHRLPELDQKLWVALSCPTSGLQFDQRTLALLDHDGDHRVRAPEIIAAIRWLETILVSLDGLVKESEELPLTAIRTDTAAGRSMLGACKQILSGLGKGEAKSIGIADAMDTARVLAAAKRNGDGVVPPEMVDDVALHKVAAELIACVGGSMDRSGKLGFDLAHIARFFDELKAFEAWIAESESDPASIRPLGDATGAAFAALDAVAAKIEDWFTRCRLAAFDPRAQALLNAHETAYLKVATSDLTLEADEIRHFPLAQIAPGADLDLIQGLNPSWDAAMARFRELVVDPILGASKRTLSEKEWRALRERFQAFVAWNAKRAGANVESLGLARVRKILSSSARQDLEAVVAEDLAVAAEFDALRDVEKLVRLHRHLYQLLNNYVSFGDFYSRKRPAIFQAGTLFLDARSCDLCVRVDDAGRHAPLGILAKTYIAYCDLRRPGGHKMTVACAFTAGDSDHLMVGRNGIFYDLEGNDWDATITSVLENPIGIRQAFWAPYKRLMRWIEQQIAKRAAEADAKANDKLISAAQATGDAATQGAQAAPKPKFDVGVVAALGVAVGGITAAVGAMLDSLFGLGQWMPLGVVGIVLIISGPSMLIAWMKLRQRNLGPILDANGWAINGRMKVNIPLGGSLTEMAKLPTGAERLLRDPFAEKKPWWPRLVAILIVLAGIAYGLWQWEGAPDWAAPARDGLRQVIPYSTTATPTPVAPTPVTPR